MEMNLNKEQLLKIKEELIKRVQVLYGIVMDYQMQIQKLDEMIEPNKKETEVETKPAESKPA